MFIVIYPRKINWFYENQARVIANELRSFEVDAVAIASDDIGSLKKYKGDALVLSLWESITSAEWQGVGPEFLEIIRGIERRVLLNYDCIFSQYFDRHFVHDIGLVTEIFDITMAPQTDLAHVHCTDLARVRCVPYKWIPEAFSSSEHSELAYWKPGRKIPWATLGHGSPDRAALVSAAISAIDPNGFIFMPPVRPYDAQSGFARDAIDRVLRQTDLYLWGSHHSYPYHEGLRALHAIAAGAIPAKIDPLNYKLFSQVPWVYPSLNKLVEARSQRGLLSLYEEARAFVLDHKTLGEQLINALGLTKSAQRYRV
jgi:hypothetical protein